jgi:hypothetical protein
VVVRGDVSAKHSTAQRSAPGCWSAALNSAIQRIYAATLRARPLLASTNRLQAEDSDDYGPPIVPETAVAEAIMQRTREHLRQLGNAAVSSKPIVMRAE